MAPGVAAVERLLEELRTASWDAARARPRRAARAGARGRCPRGRRSAQLGRRLLGRAPARAALRLQRRGAAPVLPAARACSTGCSRSRSASSACASRAADGEAPVWHPDVRFFRVADEDGTPIAAFYLDPYSRPAEKRGGAWMDECVATARRRCDCPSRTWSATRRRRSATSRRCMTFDEVRDAVPRVRSRPAAHADHGRAARGGGHPQRRVGRRRAAEPVHGELVLPPRDAARARRATSRPASRCRTSSSRRSCAARTFRAGSIMLRQLYFALLDLELHHRSAPDGGESPFDLQQRIAARHHRHPAAARGPLPLRLQPHLRGRLRGRLLQLQVGRGAVGRRVRRLRGGRPRATPRPSQAPVGASATPSSPSAAAATRWRSSGPSAVASPAPRRCSASQAWHAQPEPALTRVSGPAVPAYTARGRLLRPGGRAPSTAAGRAATAGPASPRTPRGWRSARAPRSPPGPRCCGRRPHPRASARR